MTAETGSMAVPPPLVRTKFDRRNSATLKLLFIAGLVLLLISLYSAAILRSRVRAAIIGGLLAAVYGALYIVLRMEDYALLAGTAALFAALAAVMYFTRNVDWQARDAGTEVAR